MKIINLEDLSWEKVSHPGSKVLKKTIIKNDDLPNFEFFGRAIFKKGDRIKEHSHTTMYEIFHLLEGKARFVVDGKERIFKKGNTIIIEPNELHEQDNPFDEDVEFVLFGLSSNK